MEKSLVNVVDGTVHIVTSRGMLDYEFEADRCKTAVDIIRWLRHLSAKTWFTSRHAVAFIDEMCELRGIKQFGI